MLKHLNRENEKRFDKIRVVEEHDRAIRLCSLLVNDDTQIGCQMPRLSSSGAGVCSDPGVTGVVRG